MEELKCNQVSGVFFLILPFYLFPSFFPNMLFLELALSQIKAPIQNLSKSRMLRAMSFTPNEAHIYTDTHTSLVCYTDHVSASDLKGVSYSSGLI